MEPQATQLVALSTGNNLEMEKDWEMMSELDKDEFIRKKIICALKRRGVLFYFAVCPNAQRAFIFLTASFLSAIKSILPLLSRGNSS